MAEKTPDPQQEAIFREVDEDLRHEQMARLWKQYGGYLVGAAILIVAVVAGYQGWTYWQASQRATEARAYELALRQAQEGEGPEALQPLAAFIAEAGTGYESVARLRLGELLVERGQRAEGVAAFRALAEDGDADAVMRDLGRLSAVLHGIEDGDPVELEASLQPLTNPSNALRFSALEATGLLALKQGDSVRALETFQSLSDDPLAPASLRARAEEIVVALGGEPIPPAPQAEAAPAVQ